MVTKKGINQNIPFPPLHCHKRHRHHWRRCHCPCCCWSSDVGKKPNWKVAEIFACEEATVPLDTASKSRRNAQFRCLLPAAQSLAKWLEATVVEVEDEAYCKERKESLHHEACRLPTLASSPPHWLASSLPVHDWPRRPGLCFSSSKK